MAKEKCFLTCISNEIIKCKSLTRKEGKKYTRGHTHVTHNTQTKAIVIWTIRNKMRLNKINNIDNTENNNNDDSNNNKI